MNPTKIEWTDYSSNPIYATVDGKRGWFCEKVSPGCAHCYSSTMNEGRFGNGLEFLPSNRERVEFVLNDKELAEWQKPKYRGKRVFAFDMTDLFGEWVSDEWLDKCFTAMALASGVTFQILTKRPERMREYLTTGALCRRWVTVEGQAQKFLVESGRMPYEQAVNVSVKLPLPNVWLGVTVENQRWADERIPILLDTPAAVRFVSAEPLLGPVDLNAPWPGTVHSRDFAAQLDWIIVGGESGPKHRPFNPDWARGVVSQCKDAGVACFVKQLGGLRPGNKLEDLPEDLRVREFPL